jgi:hypothetical protein
MNPQSDETQGLNLPRPTFERAGAALPPITDIPEPFRGETIPNPSADQIPGIKASPTNSPVLSAGIPDQAAQQMDYEGAVADDEWVERARDAVGRMQSDPYMLSKEVSRIKAEYIKARYNKDIKIVEE